MEPEHTRPLNMALIAFVTVVVPALWGALMIWGGQ
jgi:hypothetical protein